MAETKRFLRVSQGYEGSEWYVAPAKGQESELVLLEEYGEVGDKLVFEIVEMTQDEYDALPEFGGF